MGFAVLSKDFTPKCQWCAEPFHKGLCPWVKAMEYYESGILKRVEFWTRGELDSLMIKALMKD